MGLVSRLHSFYFCLFLYACFFVCCLLFINSAQAEKATKVTKKKLRLQLVAKGFRQPLDLDFNRAFSQGMYVSEQGGKIYRVYHKKKTQPKLLFADISSLINSSRGEEGLLGLAFSSNYNIKDSHCYVNYTGDRPSHTHVVAFKVRNHRVQLKSKRVLLRIRQPYSNHNGGDLTFGPDKKLYIATGDGGSAGDPKNLGQDRRSLLGKILRIDVSSKSRQQAYGIPPDNPFVNQSPFRQEIYAWGLRNPWRFSFDAKTGRLYAADVGQNRYEEINLIVKGGNYGWRKKEGYACYRPQKNCSDKSLRDPIHAYSRRLGQSITGGYVYRGKKLKEYYNHYFFADFISGRVWAMPLSERTGLAVGKAILLFDDAGNISSFGEDKQGELYLVEYSKGNIYKIIN